MEQVAADQSQCHLLGCWLLIIQVILASPCGVEDEDGKQTLDEEDHCTLEEVVVNALGQPIVQSNLVDHAEEGQAVDTVINHKHSLTVIVTEQAEFISVISNFLLFDNNLWYRFRNWIWDNHYYCCNNGNTSSCSLCCGSIIVSLLVGSSFRFGLFLFLFHEFSVSLTWLSNHETNWIQ